MSALSFRNIDTSPADPVESWPFEGVLAAVERGTLPDWHRLATAVYADPWGEVARQVLTAVEVSEFCESAQVMGRVVDDARRAAADSESRVVSSEITELIRRSGLSQAAFARRIGTSASRLSTYQSGKVVPSASLMVRMRRASAVTTPTSTLR